MAKTIRELENRMVEGNVIQLRSPEPTIEELTYIKCNGCSRPAAYELYENHEPHCRKHMLEAIDSKVYVLVRSLEGGYDDAS